MGNNAGRVVVEWRWHVVCIMTCGCREVRSGNGTEEQWYCCVVMDKITESSETTSWTCSVSR